MTLVGVANIYHMSKTSEDISEYPASSMNVRNIDIRPKGLEEPIEHDGGVNSSRCGGMHIAAKTQGK